MSEIPDSTLARVRALLAKAESSEFTAEAEAFTAKAAELMAKYGIEQAMVGDRDPGTDKPGDRVITVTNPWGGEKASLVYRLAKAMRCEGIYLRRGEDGAHRVHIFGYGSDLERVELLYTSLLLQMTSALARVEVPAAARSPRAYRRSWLLGYVSEVTGRVAEAERRAAAEAAPPETAAKRSTELVLADRKQAVEASFKARYPRIKWRSVSSSGGGRAAGAAAARRANIGQTGLGGRRAIGGGR